MELFLASLFIFGLAPFIGPALKKCVPGNTWREIWLRNSVYIRDHDTGKLILPNLVTNKKTPTGTAITFTLPTGFSPDDLQKAFPAIDYHFTCDTVIDTQGKYVTLYLNTMQLPSNLPYTKQQIPGTLPVYLGNTLTGSITKDLTLLPHLLIGGTTGGGKTTLLKLILSYIIQSKNAIIYGADMARTDLTFIQNYGGIFIPDPHGLQIVIDELHQELFARLDMLNNSNSENLFEHNEKTNQNIKRIVLAIDELSVFRPKPGLEKEEKQSLLYSFGRLIDLASVGRKAGIHLILCTQQPNKDVIPSLLRDNIPCRIAFKCVTRWQSDSILQSSSAVYLPVTPGRCILQHGEEIQLQVPDYNKGVMTAELECLHL